MKTKWVVTILTLGLTRRYNILTSHNLNIAQSKTPSPIRSSPLTGSKYYKVFKLT